MRTKKIGANYNSQASLVFDGSKKSGNKKADSRRPVVKTGRFISGSKPIQRWF